MYLLKSDRKHLKKVTKEDGGDGTGFKQTEHWNDRVDVTVKVKPIVVRTQHQGD